MATLPHVNTLAKKLAEWRWYRSELAKIVNKEGMSADDKMAAITELTDRAVKSSEKEVSKAKAVERIWDLLSRANIPRQHRRGFDPNKVVIGTEDEDQCRYSYDHNGVHIEYFRRKTEEYRDFITQSVRVDGKDYLDEERW